MASKPASSSSAEFALIAKMAASVDTLDGFIREMKIRFPDAAGRAAQEARGEQPKTEPAKSEPAHTGSLPAIVGIKRVEASR
jgi:hypothetical protein